MENTKKIDLPCNVTYLIHFLLYYGYEAYTVGGAVRDSLLGLEAKDYDITTNATPKDVIKIFSNFKIIETGLKHGTVTIILKNEPIEVTTYRIDGEYEDNRHPKEVKFTNNLKEDLSRRDFTINALACDVEGNIIDYFGGQEDIKKQEIKCVGNPNDRFNEDALRILRALRFASRLGFTIEEKTSEAIHNLKHLLNNISAERIQKELNGILIGKNVKQILLDYKDVFEVFIPELKAMDLKQNNKHHKHDKVYDHTVSVVDNAKQHLILRLAALFHDIGKPECYSEEIIDGKINGHFYGHPKVSARIAKEIMSRLKYSNSEIDSVVWLVGYHDVTIAETTKSVKKLLNKTPSLELFDLLLDLRRADKMDHILLEGEDYENRYILKEIKDKIISEQGCFSLKDLAVNGYDMMNLNLSGKAIGNALNLLLEAVIDEKVQNTKEELIKYLKEIK